MLVSYQRQRFGDPSCFGRMWIAVARSILRRPFDAIDDEEFARAFPGFEFQSEFL